MAAIIQEADKLMGNGFKHPTKMWSSNEASFTKWDSQLSLAKSTAIFLEIKPLIRIRERTPAHISSNTLLPLGEGGGNLTFSVGNNRSDNLTHITMEQ
jgi:hypothetical protein